MSLYPELAFSSVLLTAAAACDVTTRRVPNVLNLMIAAVGLAAQGWWSGVTGVGSGLAGGVTVGLLLFFPWAGGRLGGGDLKLAAAAGTWVGLGRLPAFLLSAALCGGVVAVTSYFMSDSDARLRIRANLTQVVVAGEMPPADTHRTGRFTVPYGLAIAAGALVTLWLWRSSP